MSDLILDPVKASGRLPANATTEEKVVATAREYEQRSGAAAAKLLAEYLAMRNLIYANRHGLTTQQIGSALGEEQMLAMRRHAVAVKSLLFYVSPSLADAPQFENDTIPTFDVGDAIPANLFPE